MPVLQPVPEATDTNHLRGSSDNLTSINVSRNYPEKKNPSFSPCSRKNPIHSYKLSF